MRGRTGFRTHAHWLDGCPAVSVASSRLLLKARITESEQLAAKVGEA